MVRGLDKGQKVALLVNEAQVGVMDPAYSIFPALAQQVEARGIVPRIAALMDQFRARGLPIFHLPVVHRPDFADVTPNSLISGVTLKGRRMAAGSIEADYIDILRPGPTDYVVSRSSGFIAFLETSLDATLRRLGVQTVVLTGVSVNVALPGNTMAAVDLGYQVVIPEDCVAGTDPAVHRTLVDNQLRVLATISTSEEVTAALG
ncbi:MAG: cysteine hydrolase [Azospirillaceae bacterium]|nr:cysteine hydrolase [Azospirillaceae bacterium]